jgi:hypothetical protein
MNLKRGYLSGSNLVKDENDDLLADSSNIVNRWKSYLSQLLNVQYASDVRQIEVHSADPLVHRPSHFQVEISIAKLKTYRSPCSDEIMAELIQAGDEILVSVIHKITNFE